MSTSRPSKPPGRTSLWVYVLAVVATAATLLGRLAVGFKAGDAPMMILFLIPILLSAYVGGLGPGLLATTVAALAANYYLMPPLHTFYISGGNAVQWVAMIVIGALLSVLLESKHRSRLARETEASAQASILTQRKVQSGFVCSLVFLGVIGVMSYFSVARLQEGEDRIHHTDDVIARLRSVVSLVTDGETAQRGYAITGDEKFLEPYTNAVARIDTELQRLREMTANNPGQRAQLDLLASLVSARMAALREAVELRRNGGFAAAQALTASGQGKQLHDRIRGIVASFEQTEQASLQDEETRVRRSSVVTKMVIICGSALAFVFVGVALFIIGQDFAGSRQAAAALRQARDGLETRVRERTAELEQSNKMLLESQALYHSLVQQMPAGVFRKDSAGRYVFVNDWFCRLSGSAPEHYLGRTPAEAAREFARPGFTSLAAGKVNELFVRGAEDHERIMRTGELIEIEEEHPLTDGRKQFLHVMKAPVFGADGKIVGSQGILIDITARKNAEERVAWLASFPEKNPNPIVELNLATGTLLYLNPAAARLFPTLAAEGLAHPYLAGLSQVAEVLRSGKTEIVRQEVVVGEGCFSQTLSYIPEDQRLRVYGNDITERKQAEGSRLRLAAIVNSSDDAIIGKTLEGMVTSWNPAAEKLFGYTAAEMIGQPMLTLFPPDRQNEEREILMKIGRGDSVVNYETVRVPKDGKHIDVSVTVSPIIAADGKIIGASKIARDITQRKRNAEAIRLSNERFQIVARATNDAVWDWDLVTNALWWNEGFEKLFHYPPAEVEAGVESWTSRLHPEDLDRVKTEIFKVINGGGKHWSDEYRFRCRDGSYAVVFDRGFVLRDADGRAVRMIGAMMDITERKQAEAKLQESEQRFRTMANSISQLAWIARADGFIFWYNQRWFKYTGTTPEEMEGGDWQRVHDPEVLPAVMARWEGAVAAGEVFEMEFPLRGADGRFRRFLTRAVPLKDAEGRVVQWFGTNTDVDELKRAEAALQESQALYHSLVEQMPAGVFRKNAEGRYVFVSSFFCRLRDTTPDQFLGRLPCELSPSEQRFSDQAAKHHTEIMQTGKSIEVLDEYHRPDGTRLYFHVVKSPVFDADGKIIGTQGVLLDVTLNKKAEDEIRRLNADLEERVLERTAQLEGVNKELEAFSYSVSHDLRAPLRHIIGFVQLLQNDARPVLSVENLRHLNTISQSAKRMGNLIDDLLAFSRIGRSEVLKKEFKLDDLIKETLQDIAPETQGRNIVWEIHPLPAVRADRGMLRLVLVNLLSNAVKFTGPRLPARIEIGCVPATGNLTTIFVRDNGVGFDPQYVHKLFGVFQRLHTQSEFEGTGIGLANVQRIIARHGGRTWAVGVVDGGATFYFSLPNSLAA